VTCLHQLVLRGAKGLAGAHLYETSRVVAIQVAEDEAALLGDAQLGHAALDELVCGHLLVLLQALLVRLGIGDAQQDAGLEGIVELHQRVAPPKGPPQQRHGVGIVVGLVLLLGHPLLEAGNQAQAHLQTQTALEQRRVLVGTLVEDIVRGLDGAAIDGGRGVVGGWLAAEEGRGGSGLGALGVAGAAVRVARVLALVALVGHEGWRPGVAGDAGVGRGGGGGLGGDRVRGMSAHEARVESKAALHASSSSPCCRAGGEERSKR
jgi:hypothetical protein